MATNTPNEPRIVSPIIMGDGFVYVDSIRIARYIAERGTLEFFDKNRERSDLLQRRTVEVRLADLAKLGRTEG